MIFVKRIFAPDIGLTITIALKSFCETGLFHEALVTYLRTVFKWHFCFIFNNCVVLFMGLT